MITAVDVGTHALNSVYVLVNLTTTAAPLRLYHFTHTVLYYLVYVVFSVVYQKSGATNGVDKPYIYVILDWDAAPGTAVVYSSLIVVVAVPVVHFSLFLLYRLRVAVVDLVLNRHTERAESALKMKEIDNT